MEPISIDPILSLVALYNRKKNSLSIVDMTNNSTMAHYDHLQIDTTVNMDHCWTYISNRKRSHDGKKNPPLNLSVEIGEGIRKTVAPEYFVCCSGSKEKSTKTPSIQINNIKKKQTVQMEMSHQSGHGGKKVPVQLSIVSLVAHPFDHILFTGCNDGSIVRWCFGEKQLTKTDYTCSSSVIAMAINTNNNTLIFMEEKASTVHVATIDKSLKSVCVLKTEWNFSSSSMRIVNNSLFGVCGNNSVVSLFKADNQQQKSDFSKFHSITLKNNIYDFDIVEYNKLYYLIVLNRKRTTLSVYPLQNMYNASANSKSDSVEPLYTINMSSENGDVYVVKIKLVAQSSKNITPSCLVYYRTSSTNTDHSNVKISIIYLDDLKWGVNSVLIGNQHTDMEKLEPILSQIAAVAEQPKTHLNEPTNQTADNNDSYATKSLPTTKTLVQTLTQVINSNDNRLLEDIISRTSTPIIDNSIRLLSSPLAYRLLSLLTDKIESNPSKSSELANWIKSILSHHISFFSTILANNTEKNGVNPLQKLQNILEFRSHFYGQLCEIQGRVSVLINHIKNEKTHDKQSELEHKLVKPTIRIDENALEETLTSHLMERDSSSYSEEFSDVDLEEMESIEESQ